MRRRLITALPTTATMTITIPDNLIPADAVHSDIKGKRRTDQSRLRRPFVSRRVAVARRYARHCVDG